MLIISGFEDDWAVIELDRIIFNLPKTLLPQESREGDVISISISVDQKATASRQQQINELAKDLFEEE